jgi:hypothetical protein
VSRSSNFKGLVREPRLHEATVPDIAAIEENALLQEASNPLEIWKAVLVPLGHEEQVAAVVTAKEWDRRSRNDGSSRSGALRDRVTFARRCAA